MILGDVESFEIAPARLYLGTFRDLVAHADEDVLERLPRLGDQVQVARETPRQDFGQIEMVSREPRGPNGREQLGSPAVGESFEPTAELVQEAAELPALLGRHRAQLLVHLGKTGPFRPERQSFPLFERRQVKGPHERGRSLGLELSDLLGRIGRHGATSRAWSCGAMATC